MKLKEKIYTFIIIILFLTFSYSLCSTHELRHPNSIFNTKRNRFCSTPFSVFCYFTFYFNICIKYLLIILYNTICHQD